MKVFALILFLPIVGVLTLEDSVQAKPGGRAFTLDYDWRIENWMSVKQNKELIQQQKFLIDTDRVRWEVGLMTNPTNYCTYMKLVGINGTETPVQYSVSFAHQKGDGTWHPYFKSDGNMKVNEQRSSINVHRWYYYLSDQIWKEWTDANGTLCLRVNLTVLVPDSSQDSPFSLRFSEQNKKNFGQALNDSTSSDLKIITSDQHEHHAHKLVLKIQCPVFAAKLSSQLAENTTGVVNIGDISGKTMGILLHFFYTGELLDSWRDTDTIVEFTYAAGKYQIDQFLEMLDQDLGGTDKEETGEVYVQLIRKAKKLSLKNAEARLIKRVNKITSNFVSLEQYKELFSNVNVNDSHEM